MWKVRIPEGFDDDTPIHLYQSLTLPGGEVDVVGMMGIGRSLAARRGWIRGHAVGEPIDAADRDDEGRPEPGKLDADAVAWGWGEPLDGDGRRMIVDGGDYFGEPPSFERAGRWLVAVDARSGKLVAYPLEALPAHREAREAGGLWLRFSGRWQRPFDVPVSFGVAG